MVRLFRRYVPERLLFLLITENVLIVAGVWAVLSLVAGGFHLMRFSDVVLLGRVLLISAVCQVSLYLTDLYNLRVTRSQLQTFVRLLKALAVASVISAALYFAIPATRFGKSFVENSVVAVIIILLLWRMLIDWLTAAFKITERAVIVGSGQVAETVLRELRSRPDLRIVVLGLVSSTSDDIGRPGVPHLGTFSELDSVIGRLKPDLLVVALQDRRAQFPADSLLKASVLGVRVEEASDLCERLTGKVPVELVRASRLIFSDDFHNSTVLRACLRLLEICGALVGLALLSPFIALIAMAIRIDSKGPVLSRQPRVGQFGHIFELIRFRSSCSEAGPGTGALPDNGAEAQLTRVGRFIHYFHLDEIPQLLNVLWGDMSFIGPRPERPSFVEYMQPRIKFYDVRHALRPGITGWAQVSRHYTRTIGETTEKLGYDLFYIKHRSISLDLLILFKTVKFLLFGPAISTSRHERPRIEVVEGSPSLRPQNSALHAPIPVALSVDVEDYFQVAAFRNAVRFEQWDEMPSRVVQNTGKVLDLLAKRDVHGTFFILGWVAEKFPNLVRLIQSAGHELACHSYRHRFVYDLTPEEFRSDTQRALNAIEDAAGVPVHAYRAPSFSITPRSVWALEVLLELGFTLDSSIFPIRHDLYGFPAAPRQPFLIRLNGKRLVEFPPPTIKIGRWSLPVTGGGYLRQFPFDYQLRTLKSMERRRELMQLYLHPWELDPEQPRIAASLRSRLRHYRGLDCTAERLERLLPLFRFGTMTEALNSVDSLSDVALFGESRVKSIEPRLAGSRA
jgi:polysaccharide deacetylase family protein (PEP-CTERM system associated)/exopolysaccharide biosynthesis polyprenyl glycosylphosphotransferase